MDLAKIAALIAVLGTAVVYGTDVFCAMVQRPALSHVDDRALASVMGSVHLYGDRRMPLPGARASERADQQATHCGGQRRSDTAGRACPAT